MCKVHIMIAGYMHSVSQLTFEAASRAQAKDFLVFLPGSKGTKVSSEPAG